MIVKWFHRKAFFMYLALDEIAGVVEFPTSLAKFFEAGFDSLPLWEKLNGKGNKVGLKRSINNVCTTLGPLAGSQDRFWLHPNTSPVLTPSP